VGSFILRPQESFSDCNQFILSFRTSGIEGIKHAVIRRDPNIIHLQSSSSTSAAFSPSSDSSNDSNSPYVSTKEGGVQLTSVAGSSSSSSSVLSHPLSASHSQPLQSTAKKYLYRCGKLGPVNSLEGILRAISDIVSDPLLFSPVIPSFLSFLPSSLLNTPRSSSGGGIGGSKEKEREAREKQKQQEEKEEMERKKLLEFSSFDINESFWKLISDILPKLVNTLTINNDLLGLPTSAQNTADDDDDSDDVGSDEEERKPSDDDDYEKIDKDDLEKETNKGRSLGDKKSFDQLLDDFSEFLSSHRKNGGNVAEKSLLEKSWNLSLAHHEHLKLVSSCFLRLLFLA
jgi:hypothetical protein